MPQCCSRTRALAGSYQKGSLICRDMPFAVHCLCCMPLLHMVCLFCVCVALLQTGRTLRCITACTVSCVIADCVHTAQLYCRLCSFTARISPYIVCYTCHSLCVAKFDCCIYVSYTCAHVPCILSKSMKDSSGVPPILCLSSVISDL